MRSDVLSDIFSLVPWRSIDINPDFEAFESMAYMLENINKTVAIPLGGPNQTPSAQKWGHPARKIEALTMLACCRNPEGLSPFCPSSAQAGMETETCLVLKDNGLLGLKASEFFLRTDETASHLPNGPGGRHGWHASPHNLSGASSSGPVGPSDLSRSIASNGQPVLGHPTQHETSQTPEDFSRDEPRVVAQTPRSVVQDGQAVASAEEIRCPRGSPHPPIDISSCGLDPILELSIPDAGPPIPATEPRSSCQPRLPGLFGQGPATARESNRGDIQIVSSYSKYSIKFTIM